MVRGKKTFHKSSKFDYSKFKENFDRIKMMYCLHSNGSNDLFHKSKLFKFKKIYDSDNKKQNSDIITKDDQLNRLASSYFNQIFVNFKMREITKIKIEQILKQLI